jgi:two-component system phosphate regulon sensor histidine kinase PhoR
MKKKRPLHRFSRNLQVGLIALYCATLLFVLIATQGISRKLLINHLKFQVKSLIHELPDNGNERNLLNFLQREKNRLFFRVTLLKDQYVIFESQNANSEQDYLKNYYKLIEAQTKGFSYDEHFSSVTLKEMAYMAVRFDYDGHQYILRSSFPLGPMKDLQVRLQITFVAVSSITFLIFGIMIWLLIRRLNRPLEMLLQTISQKGAEILDPSAGVSLIRIQNLPQDFDALLITLNGLSERVNMTLHTLAQERNEREAILRSMTEAVISIDANMELIYSNPAGYQILELPTPIESFHHALRHPRLDKIRLLCKQCQEYKIPIIDEIDLSLGHKKMHLDILVNPISDGGVTLLVRDTSQQHELNEMRKGFVTNASHELRTPITIIRGYAETLYDHPDIAIETRKGIMQTIMNNCMRMNSLITNLMNLSKIENLPLQDLSVIDLAENVQEAVTHLQSVHSTARITLKIDGLAPLILGQESLISVVIKNLIENAVRYSDGSPVIEIFLRHEEGFINLIINDNGIGIPEIDLPYIFERFYTVDKARSKKVGGYGLGLAIVKTIIDKHNGTIQVDSRMGHGTKFTILIPAYDENERSKHQKFLAQ